MNYFFISLKQSMVYRWSVFCSMFSSIIYIACNIVLWRVLYVGDTAMISYMTRYALLSSLIGMFYTRNVHRRIEEKMITGAFAIDLIRPINLFSMTWQVEFADVISNLIFRGLPIVLLFSPVLFGADYYNILPAFIAVILGHILFFLVYSLLGLVSLFVIEIEAIGRLLDDTIRFLAGGFLPLSILPGALKRIANVLPFRYLYSFPLELLLGPSDFSSMIVAYATLSLWIVFFLIMNALVYRIAVRKVIIQGG